jgi:hypothetical protein
MATINLQKPIEPMPRLPGVPGVPGVPGNPKNPGLKPHPLMHLVLACALFPLLTCITLVVIYAKTYASWVPTAELVFLICAPGFFVAGGACLSLANAPSRRPPVGPASDVFETRFWHRVVLLLANIPAAIAGGYIVNILENETVVAIENDTGEAIDRCDVIAIDSVTRRTVSHIPVPVNGHVRSAFTLDEEGTVRVTVFQHNVKVDIDVITSIHPAGVKQRVRIDPGLKYQIECWE